MRSLIKFFIVGIIVLGLMFGIMGAVWLVNTIADKFLSNLPPIMIYLLIVGGFAGISYFIYKQEK